MTLVMLDMFTVACASLVLTSLCFLASNILLAPVLRLIRVVSGPGAPAVRRSVGSISIVVPAYNEEETIGEKIDSLQRALQRVDVDAEVLIGSDGSTDRTAEIVRARFKDIGGTAHWRLLEFPNEGKCSTINKLVAAARGEVIVSTDADIPVPEYSIEIVLDAFNSNARLGCLSCIPRFDGLEIGSQKQYWSIEQQIRRSESALRRLIVVTGMLYAYRRDLFEQIPKGVMADDLWIPLHVLLKGYESVQAEDLRVPYEDTDEEMEMARRRRVIVGGMDVVRRLWPRLILVPPVLLLVLFHKVNRWIFPFWLFLLLGAAGMLMPWILFAYVLGIALGLWYLGRRRFLRVVDSVIDPVLSLAEAMRKTDFAQWEHTRKH